MIGDLGDRFGFERTNGRLSTLFEADEAGRFEFVEVVGDRGRDLLRARDMAADLSRRRPLDAAIRPDRGRAAAAIREEFHDVEARPVPKSPQSTNHHFVFHRNDYTVCFDEYRIEIGGLGNWVLPILVQLCSQQ